MLILRRKAGESIVIGDEIKVTVIDINEGSIRLAVEAPKRITVLRSELLQAADVNRDAAKNTPDAAPRTLLSILPQGSPQNQRPVLRREKKSEAEASAPTGQAETAAFSTESEENK